MRVLVVGASGFIGRELFSYLKNNTDYQIHGTFFSNKRINDLIQLDITKQIELEKFFLSNVYDKIIWVTGLKDIKKCENDPTLALTINSTPVERMVKILNTINYRGSFIYLSTDYVFEGIRGQYMDTDIPAPRTNYGISKYLGEKALSKAEFDYNIVRSSAVMGKEGIFFDWLIDNLSSGDVLSMFYNSYFTPTPHHLLCQGILYVVNNKTNKIVHICGDKRMTRYGFAGVVKQMDLKFKAVLRKEYISKKNNLFQHDISIAQSDICKKFQDNSFEEYIKKEIRC